MEGRDAKKKRNRNEGLDFWCSVALLLVVQRRGYPFCVCVFFVCVGVPFVSPVRNETVFSSWCCVGRDRCKRPQDQPRRQGYDGVDQCNDDDNNNNNTARWNEPTNKQRLSSIAWNSLCFCVLSVVPGSFFAVVLGLCNSFRCHFCMSMTVRRCVGSTLRNAHNGSKPNSTEPTDQPMIMINTVDLLQTTARSTTPRRPIGTIRSLSARATRREKKRTAHCRKRKSTRTSTVEKSGTLPTTANVSESPLSGTAG